MNLSGVRLWILQGKLQGRKYECTECFVLFYSCNINVVIHINCLCYLKNTIFHGVTISKTSSSTLTCFSDADWAGSLDDWKSTSAYLLFLGNTPISWSSKKQRAIARSSTEAEYKTLATVADESGGCYLYSKN